MDVIGKIVQGTGCNVDGTVSSQNPLTRALDSVLQSQYHHSQPVNPPLQSTPHHRINPQHYRNIPQNEEFMIQQYEQEAMQRHLNMEKVFHDTSIPNPMHHPIPPPQYYLEQAYAESLKPSMHVPRQYQSPYMSRHVHTPQENWVNEFQQLQLQDTNTNTLHTAWEETKETALQLNTDKNINQDTTRQISNDMANELRRNQDPKWQNSEFLKFVQQVGNGEIELDQERNDIKSVSTLDSAWKESQDVRSNRDISLDEAWSHSMEEIKVAAPSAVDRQLENVWEGKEMNESKKAIDEMFESAWADENDINLEALWEKAVNDAYQPTDTFEDAWAGLNYGENIKNEYTYKSENPFLTSSENFQRGKEFFNVGNLEDAILAFEAEVQQHSENSEAWRMLGECHAENDEDKKAIVCLDRAVEEDPYNLNALLALGVSHVNELNPHGALKTLKAWVQHNPKFHGLEIRIDEYSDGSLMDEVMALMLQAKAHDPTDSDVLVVLGVLYNVSKDYDAAVASFQNAVGEKPEEYSLWNKIGATLANSNRSIEAIPSYHRALEIKPRYARGWLNLGISHANLGNYEEATKCYLQALQLNKRAEHIWSYLRICFTCMERFDLVKLADTRDISVFQKEFQLLQL